MLEQNRRPRRLRATAATRALVEENFVLPSNLIYPLFVMEGTKVKSPINSMPGIYRFSIDELLKEIEYCLGLGIEHFALFPVIKDELKDKVASEAFNVRGLYLSAIRKIKESFPEAWLMTDIALDPYSSDGHDGLVENGQILNDETVSLLSQMAVAQAQQGADFVGPSDMMDGRVAAIRAALDEANYKNTGIISYTAKYASAFYGPFRDALDSAPKFGDKKSYQMNPANAKEALIEAELDFQEGADIIMVKPGLPYLDIIKQLSENSPLPIAAYNVSGEYAMIKAAAQNGWIDEKKAMLETLVSFKRAGASIILTYFAKEFGEYYKMQAGK